MKNLFIGSLVLASIIFAGCEDGACCNGTTLEENRIDERGNVTPIANFTDIAIVSSGSDCTFSANGSSSTDSDGNVNSYEWTIDGTTVSTAANPINITVPCSTEDQRVCLTVTDDDNASSLEKCTLIEVTGTDPQPEPETSLIPPEAIITFSENVGDSVASHTFSCETSYDKDAIDTDNSPENDPQVVACHWEVFKTQADGTYTTPHPQDGMTKWINTSDDFTALHVTLTVTDDDGQTTTVTNSYALPEDLN
ncbi:MAG: PKD domain-containing protein [Epsilonproteobacteria bacterium]|nr:PKD domain-containing protein [Campylobacterota bacterium]